MPFFFTFMKAIIGRKKEMTQIYNEKGRVVPCTIIDVSDVVVSRVRKVDSDGYAAVVLGIGKKKSPSKSEIGIYKDLGYVPESVIEVKVGNEDEMPKIKDKIYADIFKEEEKVKIRGTTKGKGFQGVVKRYGFAGWNKTHGATDRLRAPGSIGSEGYQKVYKGKKMPGRMGGERHTTANLKIVKVDKDKNIICVSGAVPGGRNSLVLITGKNNNE